MTTIDTAFIIELLTFFGEEDMCDELRWNVEDGAIKCFYVNTSDLLAWGCADGEFLTPDTFPVLKQCVADTKAASPVVGTCYAVALFACRINNSRPQGAAYPMEKELWPLFDACGPERPTGLGNPYKPGKN